VPRRETKQKEINDLLKQYDFDYLLSHQLEKLCLLLQVMQQSLILFHLNSMRRFHWISSQYRGSVTQLKAHPTKRKIPRNIQAVNLEHNKTEMSFCWGERKSTFQIRIDLHLRLTKV